MTENICGKIEARVILRVIFVSLDCVQFTIYYKALLPSAVTVWLQANMVIAVDQKLYTLNDARLDTLSHKITDEL